MTAKDNQETAKTTPRAQFNKYFDEVSTMTVPSKIFDFGKREGVNFLLFLLSPVFTHTLCIPASSAPVERIFSASELIMRPQRARLSSEMLEIFVYLKCNSNFFGK